MFFVAEFATAVAGWVLEINPFDQPNVAEAKDATKRVLAAGDAARRPATPTTTRCASCWRARGAGAYIALMGYLAPSPSFDAGGRRAARDADARARALATTFGYGPRFLHSTGQLHKGGAPVGRFLSLIADEGPDVEIPGASYSFRTLKTAQALGDLQTLRSHGLPAEIVRLDGRPGGRAARPPLKDQGDALMQIGFVGLGKMGGNMVARIRRDSDHEVVAFDFDAKAVARARRTGAKGAASLRELVKTLEPPRMVWIMVPAGDPTQQTVDALAKLLDADDTIVDGGNSRWTDDKARASARATLEGPLRRRRHLAVASGASRSATA